MTKNKIKIFVACGSGIATSTVVQEKVKTLFKENNIQAEVSRGNLNQIPSQDGKVDLILVTSSYKKEINTPIIQVSNLLSGIKETEKNEEIIEASEKIINSNKHN